MNNNEKELVELEQKIKLAQKNGSPIKEFILREIELLEQSIEQFVAQMGKENRLNDINIASIEIRQYATIRELAKKINIPYEKYDNLIKNVKIRIFGEDNYDKFFEE